MSDPTFAEQMVAKYEALLLQCAGLATANVDGQQISLNDLESKYNHWKKIVAKEQGSRPRVAQINLGHG